MHLKKRFATHAEYMASLTRSDFMEMSEAYTALAAAALGSSASYELRRQRADALLAKADLYRNTALLMEAQP